MTIEDAKGKKTKVRDAKVFVRWRIELPHNPLSNTWEDRSLIKSWIDFDRKKNGEMGFCIVTGKSQRICQNHSRFIRSSGDGAKLISGNDFSGYTFRGRFTDKKGDYEKQACSVGYEVSQKAHNALRWLIGRQAFKNGEQVIVAWAVSGHEIPSPFASTYALFGIEIEEEKPVPQSSRGDAGQAFGRRLTKLISGYRAQLGSAKEIVVMGLDSASPGRMAMIFYRELTGSELLDRIQSWHENLAWHQHYSKEVRFVGAPSPKEIAETAYGRRLDDKLSKTTIERLLPCIIDGQRIPRDLVESAVRSTCNRLALEHWEFEKHLGITCALFKCYFAERRNYQMALEEDRTTRDYLYGRLLAIAEHIENRALYIAGENRETSAARLMQRFADRPCSTWRTIELSLSPYKTRLRANRPTFLNEMEKQLDGVISRFQEQDFLDERRLSGEFLLAYHCQRQDLWTKKELKTDEEHSNS